MLGKKDGAPAFELTPDAIHFALRLPRGERTVNIAMRLLKAGNYSSLDRWPAKSQDEGHKEVWDLVRKWSSSPEGQSIKPFTYIFWIVDRILRSP
jgi:hypothetical protein